MEVVNWRIVEQMCRHFEVCCVVPRGSIVGVPGSVRVLKVPLSPLARFLADGFVKTARVAADWKPHIVVAGSALTAPHALVGATLSGGAAIAYVHGLDVAAPNLLYKTLWIPVLRRLDRVIANSNSTAELVRETGVASERIAVVHPGVDVPRRIGTSRARAKALLGINDRPSIISVGRLTRRKGLLEFIRKAMPAVLERIPDAILLVVGESPDQALFPQAVTKKELRTASEEAGVADSVMLLGAPTNKELATAYLASDVYVFPVRDIPGNPEGFGIVALEAAAFGVPTVAFSVGGVKEAVGDGMSGKLVTAGDYAGFSDAVVWFLERKEDPTLRRSCRRFARNFTWDKFGEGLKSVFDSCLSDGKA